MPLAPCDIDGAAPIREVHTRYDHGADRFFGNFIQSSPWPQNWQVGAEFDALSAYYTTQSHHHWH